MLISYFPARIIDPVCSVSASVNPGGVGTLAEISSNGKFSLDGRPPPREIIPIIDLR
jgi:hypothetical protein